MKNHSKERTLRSIRHIDKLIKDTTIKQQSSISGEGTGKLRGSSHIKEGSVDGESRAGYYKQEGGNGPWNIQNDYESKETLLQQHKAGGGAFALPMKQQQMGEMASTSSPSRFFETKFMQSQSQTSASGIGQEGSNQLQPIHYRNNRFMIPSHTGIGTSKLVGGSLKLRTAAAATIGLSASKNKDFSFGIQAGGANTKEIVLSTLKRTQLVQNESPHPMTQYLADYDTTASPKAHNKSSIGASLRLQRERIMDYYNSSTSVAVPNSRQEGAAILAAKSKRLLPQSDMKEFQMSIIGEQTQYSRYKAVKEFTTLQRESHSVEKVQGMKHYASSVIGGPNSIISGGKEVDVYAFQKKYLNSRTSLGNVSSHIAASRILNGMDDLPQVDEEPDPLKEGTRDIQIVLKQNRLKHNFVKKLDDVFSTVLSRRKQQSGIFTTETDTAGRLTTQSSSCDQSIILNQSSLEHKFRLKKNLQNAESIKTLEAKIRLRKFDIKNQMDKNSELAVELQRQAQVQEVLGQELFAAKEYQSQASMHLNRDQSIQQCEQTLKSQTSSAQVNMPATGSQFGMQIVRVHSMYSNIVHSEIEREKSLMQGLVLKVKNERVTQGEVLQQLRDQKKTMLTLIKRYKELIQQISNKNYAVKSQFNVAGSDSTEVQSHSKLNKELLQKHGLEAAGLKLIPFQFNIEEVQYEQPETQNQKGIDENRQQSRQSNFVEHSDDFHHLRGQNFLPVPHSTHISDLLSQGLLSKVSHTGHYVDIIKIEKFTTSTKSLLKIQQAFDIILGFLDHCQSAFGCHKATFFLLNQRLNDEFFKQFTDPAPANATIKEIGVREKYRHYIHTVAFDDTQSVDDTNLMAIARGSKELCLGLIFPSVITIEKDAIRQQDKMAICLKYHKDDDDILGIIQLEYDHKAGKDEGIEDSSPKKNRAQSQMHQASHKHLIHHHHNKSHHFSLSDENTLKVFSTFLALRLEKLIFQRDSKQKHKERGEAIHMLSVLCKQKTFKSMIRKSAEELKAFFSLGDCSLLFHSKRKDQLFTILEKHVAEGEEEDDSDDDGGMILMQGIYGEEEISQEQYEAIRERKRERLRKQKNNPMNDFIVKPKEVLWFPCSLGLTSRAFNEDYICYNNIKKKRPICPVDPIDERYKKRLRVRCEPTEFLKDIDNSLGAKNIENYIIVAIKDPNGQPNGLLQLFNFKEPITRIQIERLKAMGAFLGGCLDNITEYLKTLQTVFGMQLDIGKCENVVTEAFYGKIQTLSDCRDLEVPINFIRKQADKLDAMNKEIDFGDFQF